ncbi:hypothetical protein [Mesorhizobium sp. RMAD-H1]|uniref:hypothetical protein n=1 Tax=Mesorhizobium sp. RMAD-H1 TaxID=2587065 RepID=UPI001610ABE4|nr:hypothetical protein [Mesorhizobium sp. RMAD-H1]MBB2973948.1 hypothetical protein [Mesorhizobium sp. RMAD-H1]
MPWAIFNREFNWRRPKSVFSFHVLPSPEPQSRPSDVIAAAVAAGAAVEVESPNLAKKRNSSGRNRAE